jgi:hypothetical protein
MKFNIKGYTVLIDKEDEELVKQYSWRICSKELKQGLIYFHSMSSRKIKPRKDYRLHRLIMNAPVGSLVDHIDRNTLNCRKKNLRICDAHTNARNRTPSTRKPKKYAHLKKGYKVTLCNVHLGYYPTAKKAWEIKDVFSILLFGSLYPPHFPEKMQAYLSVLKDNNKLESILHLRKKKETIALLSYMRQNNKDTRWVKTRKNASTAQIKM